jgi:uncharacterized membrane protein
VWALRAADPTASVGQLYEKAMRIGRDHVASTVDTLVLAYAFTLASRPAGDILTSELLAEEIVRTLVGAVTGHARWPSARTIGSWCVLEAGPDQRV